MAKGNGSRLQPLLHSIAARHLGPLPPFLGGRIAEACLKPRQRPSSSGMPATAFARSLPETQRPTYTGKHIGDARLMLTSHH